MSTFSVFARRPLLDDDSPYDCAFDDPDDLDDRAVFVGDGGCRRRMTVHGPRVICRHRAARHDPAHWRRHHRSHHRA